MMKRYVVDHLGNKMFLSEEVYTVSDDWPVPEYRGVSRIRKITNRSHGTAGWVLYCPADSTGYHDAWGIEERFLVLVGSARREGRR